MGGGGDGNAGQLLYFRESRVYYRILWSWTGGTNRLYWPIRSESDISVLRIRHQNASTFDAQTDERGKNRTEISEK